MAYKKESCRGVKGVEKGMEGSCLLPYKLQVVHAIHEQIRSGLISMDRSEGRSMRVFIALDVPDKLRRELCACTERLSDHLLGRFVPCESYHLTLAFMGELDEGQVDDAVAALNDLAAQAAPAILAPSQLGTFGKPIDSVLWMGVEPRTELLVLAERLRSALAGRGLPFDSHEFVPHITLARHARVLCDALPHLEPPQPVVATTVGLYASTLGASGPTYTLVHRCALDG